ncbi:SGNH hydrolase-type esterase domain-containing protein [Lasiosphaeria hispida]|uniref:SGNH hydrolase-type esterase domain-containing protein n=1 Tax=Lasiosphaeria hispida TaxID=260671 RepID=A0AAJ0MGB7_9PEZI|nr:SGNH hydrolase-type esterase domain-containing protein [Lasiosphaeria hispida]
MHLPTLLSISASARAASLPFFSPSSQHILSLPASRPKITGLVAFGDSYSAGIGTPIAGKENDCRQGTGAYPFLIAADLLPNTTTTPYNNNNNNNNNNNTNAPPFQWLSCTGSTTADLLSSGGAGGVPSQIDRFNATPGLDAATLSIGGNDLGFFDVMNACVFRFYSVYSGTCEAALVAADAAVAGPEFGLRLGLVLREILDKVRWERRPGFVVTVTGYARFFDEVTEGCDDVSLGVWWGVGIDGKGPRLTREVRARMNALVGKVNGNIRGAVEGVNAEFVRPRVVFVDYDAAFAGHRFCEAGVEEPDYQRNETWFFLPGGPDNGAGGNGTDSGWEETLAPDSPLVSPTTCLPAAEKSGDWGELALCYMAKARHRDPTLRPREGIVSENSMWYVPTSYGKTFHPRSLGHEAIRDKVYEAWGEYGVGIRH